MPRKTKNEAKTKAAKKTPPKKARPKKGDEPSINVIKEILHLPANEEGDEKLKKMLSAFDDSFSRREKLFILFFTYPLSSTCGKVNKSGEAVGGSWKSWGSWAYQQPRVRQKINELATTTTIQELEDIFREDIEFNRQVLAADRTSFKKDNVVDLEAKNISFDTIDDKKISELTPAQRKLVAGFDYDKNGRAHYSIETRASARQALQTYYKMLTQKAAGADDKKTETIVTLEGIREKATAKISIIQHNSAEAEAAGEFIDTMADLDEEA